MCFTPVEQKQFEEWLQARREIRAWSENVPKSINTRVAYGINKAEYMRKELDDRCDEIEKKAGPNLKARISEAKREFKEAAELKRLTDKLSSKAQGIFAERAARLNEAELRCERRCGLAGFLNVPAEEKEKAARAMKNDANARLLSERLRVVKEVLDAQWKILEEELKPPREVSSVFDEATFSCMRLMVAIAQDAVARQLESLKGEPETALSKDGGGDGNE